MNVIDCSKCIHCEVCGNRYANDGYAGECSYFSEHNPSGDLIKRNLAIAYAVSGLVRKIDGEDWIKTSEVKQSLNDVPTVEAYTSEDLVKYISVTEDLVREKSERPQGEWDKRVIHTPNYNVKRFFCSGCGKNEERFSNFCPNCGADMRKGGAE